MSKIPFPPFSSISVQYRVLNPSHFESGIYRTSFTLFLPPLLLVHVALEPETALSTEWLLSLMVYQLGVRKNSTLIWVH